MPRNASVILIHGSRRQAMPARPCYQPHCRHKRFLRYVSLHRSPDSWLDKAQPGLRDACAVALLVNIIGDSSALLRPSTLGPMMDCMRCWRGIFRLSPAGSSEHSQSIMRCQKQRWQSHLRFSGVSLTKKMMIKETTPSVKMMRA